MNWALRKPPLKSSRKRVKNKVDWVVIISIEEQWLIIVKWFAFVGAITLRFDANNRKETAKRFEYQVSRGVRNRFANAKSITFTNVLSFLFWNPSLLCIHSMHCSKLICFLQTATKQQNFIFLYCKNSIPLFIGSFNTG